MSRSAVSGEHLALTVYLFSADFAENRLPHADKGEVKALVRLAESGRAQEIAPEFDAKSVETARVRLAALLGIKGEVEAFRSPLLKARPRTETTT